MTHPNVNEQAAAQLRQAREARSGRSAMLVYGGPETRLTQTVVGLRQGTQLSEHQNPGEATVLVIEGHVQLVVGDDRTDGGTGDLMTVPPQPHSLEALADSLVLLTAVKLA